MPTSHSERSGWSLGRREFLRLGNGLAVSGLASPALAGAAGSPAGPARTCILVYLLGGPPHLDMWDLKPDAPAEVRGPFRPANRKLKVPFECARSDYRCVICW